MLVLFRMVEEHNSYMQMWFYISLYTRGHIYSVKMVFMYLFIIVMFHQASHDNGIG